MSRCLHTRYARFAYRYHEDEGKFTDLYIFASKQDITLTFDDLTSFLRCVFNFSGKK